MVWFKIITGFGNVDAGELYTGAPETDAGGNGLTFQGRIIISPDTTKINFTYSITDE